jgi:hypothetical protein
MVRSAKAAQSSSGAKQTETVASDDTEATGSARGHTERERKGKQKHAMVLSGIRELVNANPRKIKSKTIFRRARQPFTSCNFILRSFRLYGQHVGAGARAGSSLVVLLARSV